MMIQDKEYKSSIIKKIKYFVLDMDGTIYLGDKLFPFTIPFLDTLKKCAKEYCFFTNNSSKNTMAYIEKLAKMNINIENNKMLISNHVIIDYIKKHHPSKSVYVVGTPYLVQDFINANIEINDTNPQLAILGFDTTLTYEKLIKICDFVRNGVPILGLNPDLNCPTENGYIPDCGSIARLIEASTGVLPEFFGKPSHHTLTYILNTLQCKEEEMAIIGDRLYTDIATAAGTKVTSILVLTGESTLEDLKDSNIKPTMVCSSLQEITEILNATTLL